MKNSTLIIAEAGVNHNGNIDIALQLVDAAANAGADWIKFQTFNADRQVTQSAKKANYQNISTGSLETHYEMLKSLELTEVMHDEIILHCRKRNIGFLSTGFDIESVNLLVNLGQEVIKIPSGEINNYQFLHHIGNLKKQVILSTGMANLGEIERAIDVLEAAGTPRSLITVLHCTTEYPAPMSEVNLRAMQTLHSAFGVAVGYSDHTLGIEVSIAAVAMGATIIEKHFTLDRNLPGPDHGASIEPAELSSLVSSIRNIELALGDGVKRPTISEIKNREIVRKSIVASTAIKAGDILSATNMTVKRPGDGISPMSWNDIVGCVAKRDFFPDELIEL